MRAACLLLLTACGGAETAPSDTSGPGTNPLTEDPGGTPPPVDSTAPPEDTSWECNEWYPCQDCGGQFCGGQISACAGDSLCGAALNDWAYCVLQCGDPRACADTFAASGGAAALSLLECVEASCAAVCDL